MTPEQSLQLLDLPNITTSRWIGQLHERHRHYHTQRHVEQMLVHIPPSYQTKELVAAIWLHDIVYDPHGFNNEALSAQQAQQDLRNWHAVSVDRVVQLILGTKFHMPAGDEQNTLNDLDLLILAGTHEQYRAYVQGIRMEYAHVPTAIFKANRALFMEHFLDRPRIYMTESFQRHEEQARKNIAYEIEELRS
jgi:predicted metal-dependent HD superfamily phosphohydrolase